MASVIEVENMRDGYIDVAKKVWGYGKEVAPRGLKTRELEDVIIVLADPTDSLPVGVGRRINPSVAAVEALQLIGAFSSPTLVRALVPGMARFAEDDGFYWGAYGDRIGSQLLQCERKLRSDRDTRQAVATLWDSWRDNQKNRRDYPCTVMLAFTIRRDKLIMHTTMRSNDVWLGLAQDAFQFTQVQLALAESLDLDVGHYVHHVLSLHLYEEHFDAVNSLQRQADPSSLRFGAIGKPGDYMADRLQRARALAEEDDVRDLTPHEAWLRKHTYEKAARVTA